MAGAGTVWRSGFFLVLDGLPRCEALCSRLRISRRSWLPRTWPPLLVGASGGTLLPALGVACGGLHFQDADLASLACVRQSLILLLCRHRLT